jgi:MFS family permease
MFRFVADQRKRVVLLAALGGLLEFYDFIIYALFAKYFAELFFPAGNSLTALMAAFGAFAVGYLVRPIGGVVFAHFGDKYGRKKTFSTTVLLMALSTLLLGLVPSYAQVGMAAPIAVLLLRVVQGFSVGGEIPGALTYVSEVFAERKGLMCGWILFGLINGMVLGMVLHLILAANLQPTQMLSWGWRLAFWLGGAFGLVSYRLRRQLYESPEFVAVLAVERATYPLIRVIQVHWPRVLACFFYVAALASAITLLFLFTPAYLVKIVGYAKTSVSWALLLGLILATCGIVVVATLTDKYGSSRVLAGSLLVSVLLGPAVFVLYSLHVALVWPVLLSAIILATVTAAVPAVVVELFPVALRYSGIALSYNLAFAVFAGLGPLLATGLISLTGMLAIPGFYLAVVALLSGLVLLLAGSHGLAKKTPA